MVETKDKKLLLITVHKPPVSVYIINSESCNIEEKIEPELIDCGDFDNILIHN